jgi:hypothetical protein
MRMGRGRARKYGTHGLALRGPADLVHLSGGRFYSERRGAGVSSTTLARFWLAGVEVVASKQTGAVVALGDSITDGSQSTVDANTPWTDQLARRLLAEPGNRAMGSSVTKRPAKEEVLLLRDEMANLAWGIENLVPDGLGGGMDGLEAATALRQWLEQLLGTPESPSSPPANTAFADRQYVLGTSVPGIGYPSCRSVSTKTGKCACVGPHCRARWQTVRLSASDLGSSSCGKAWCYLKCSRLT